MDACDPGVNSADLKTLLKQKLGIDLKLSRNEICDVYSSIQDGKLPLPPLVLSRDRSHMMDRKSPLTISDFDKLFSSSTKVTSIRRIAKKVGVARHADKKLTKAQLIGIIGRRLHALKVYEPIKFHSTQKTKIIRESINSVDNQRNENNLNRGGRRNNNERNENNVNRGGRRNNNERNENNVNRGGRRNNNERNENNVNRDGRNNNERNENNVNNERNENRPPKFSKKRPFFLKRTSGPYVNVEKNVIKTQFNKLNRALFGEKTNDEQDEFERLSKIRRVVRRGKEKFKEQIEKDGYSNLTNREIDKYWEYLMKISKKRIYNEITGFTPSSKIIPWGLFKRTPPSSKKTPETGVSSYNNTPESGSSNIKNTPETGNSNNVKNTLNTSVSTFVKKTKKKSKNNTNNVKKQLFNNRYNQAETLKNKYREYLRDKSVVRIIRNYQNNTKSGFFGKSKFPTLNNANKAIQNRINIIKIGNSVRNQFNNDKNKNIVNRVLNNLESGKSGFKTEVQVIGKINELLTQKNEAEAAKANAQRKAEENSRKKNEAEAAKANARRKAEENARRKAEENSRKKNEAEAAKANAQRRKNEAAIGKAIAKQKKIETETEIQRIKNETVTKMYRGYSTELNNVSNLNQLENIHRRYKKSKISKVWKQKLNKKYKNKKLELNSNSTIKRSSGGIFGGLFGKKSKNKNKSNNGNNNTSNETDEKITLTEKIQRTRNKFQDTGRKFQDTGRKFQDTGRKFQDTGRKFGKIFVKKEKKIKVDPKPIPKNPNKSEISGGKDVYLRLIRELREVENSEQKLKALRREGFLRLHPNKNPGFNKQYFILFKSKVDKLLEKFQKREPEPNKKRIKQRSSLEKLLKSSKNLANRNKYFRRLEGGENFNSVRRNAIKEIRSLADARRRKAVKTEVDSQKQRSSLEKLLKSSKNLTNRNKYFRRLEGGENFNSVRRNAIKEIRSLADARRRKAVKTEVDSQKQRSSLEKLLKSSKNLTDRNKYFRRLEGGENFNSVRRNAIKEIRSLADARRRKENNAKAKAEAEAKARRRKENNAKAKAEAESRKKKEYNNKMKIKRQMELKKQKNANNTKNRENKRRLELKKQMEAKAIEASKKAQAAKDEIIAKRKAQELEKRKAQELEKRKRDTFKRQIQSSYLTSNEKSSYIKQVNAVANFKPLVKKIKSAMLKASEDAKKRVGKASLLEQMYGENKDNMRKRAELNAKKRKEARVKIKQYMKKTYPSMSDRDRKMYANRIKNTEWKMLGGYIRGTQGMSANEAYDRVKLNINRNWKGRNVKLESKKREINRKIKKRGEKMRRRVDRKR
jgi:hypothetical protein